MMRSSPGVSIQPRLRPLTRMRHAISENAALLVSAASAPLEMLYGERNGCPRVPDMATVLNVAAAEGSAGGSGRRKQGRDRRADTLRSSGHHRDLAVEPRAVLMPFNHV